MKYDGESARALLTRTPSVLQALLADLPETWLDAPEGPGAWSPRDVACHLADLERDGWLPRVRAILEHGADRPLPAIDRERFRERYAGASLEVVLDDFRRARESNLRELDGLALDDAALARVGRHPTLGEVRLSQLLSAWVVHDLTHLAQIARALASQYREEVGPWIEFLSILRARGSAGAGAPAGG
jgi:hypothetical protein